MFNQFIVVGKVYELDMDAKVLTLYVERGFLMFSTGAADLIKMDLSGFPEWSLKGISTNAVVMVKGRLASHLAKTPLVVDRIINMGASAVESNSEYKEGQWVYVKDNFGRTRKARIANIDVVDGECTYAVIIQDGLPRAPIFVKENSIAPVEED